ncbi:MAG: hypothetical protein K2N34_12925 [Lachnospiraceae bacterium]|nr:hypothetical protein [Lachnospiraceae bacterium]
MLKEISPMSFLLDFMLEQCGYHLGSAIDDNPLAVLASQYCGGSPRVFSEMYLLHIGNNFPAVLCLFYQHSFYFCPSLLSLSVQDVLVMLDFISAVSGGQLTLFRVIALFKFILAEHISHGFSVNLIFEFIFQK